MRAYGQLRIFGNKKLLNLFRINALESMDEVTHHLLESMYIHLHFTQVNSFITKGKETEYVKPGHI